MSAYSAGIISCFQSNWPVIEICVVRSQRFSIGGNMRTKFQKIETFDCVCIFAFLAFVSLICYLYSNGQNVLGGIALFLSVWALLIIIGRFVTGTAYLEGHVVRLIRKNHGRMKKN
jgi:hypothetical protein